MSVQYCQHRISHTHMMRTVFFTQIKTHDPRRTEYSAETPFATKRITDQLFILLAISEFCFSHLTAVD